MGTQPFEYAPPSWIVNLKKLTFAIKFYTMKKGMILGILSVGSSLALMLLLGGCIQDKCISTSTYTLFEPVFLLPEEMRKPIETEAPRGLEHPGKIYYYQDFLLINELHKGIHVIDNRDPSNPVPVKFINIPGNVDMAVRNNVLYADNYVDLVAIDITTPAAPVFLSRTESVFPNAFSFVANRGFVVEYRETPTVREMPCERSNDAWFWAEDDAVFVDMQRAQAFSSSASGSVSFAPNAVGIGGSMARFTIAADHYLYTIDQSRLRVFNLSQPAAPAVSAVVDVAWGIETIFPYGQNLFIGANNGMFIYSISNPLQPVQVSRFQHAQACDPVFVSGNFAFVTLRDGTDCRNFVNQLDVINISNLSNPRLVKTYPMHNPHGLSVSNDVLYICENTQGMKVFDATDVNRISERLLDHETGFTAFDVIALPGKNVAMVIGKDGLYQFDTSDPRNLRRLSVMAIHN